MVVETNSVVQSSFALKANFYVEEQDASLLASDSSSFQRHAVASIFGSVPSL